MSEQESILGLAIIRRNRGISLEQISESTKISMRWLRAIEGGEFKKLPGGIYAINYIRQYARSIDFDEAELLRCYHAKTVDPAAEAQPPSRGRGGFGGLRPASTPARS